MSNFTFTIQAPELAAAIAALAAAVSGAKPTAVANPAPAIPQAPPVAQAAPIAVSAPVAPPVPPVQVQPPVTPVANPTPIAPPPVVPTAAAPTYSRDQIMTAGAALIDSGKISELMGLLNAFGVQAVTQLKQEQLGAFATEMRKLGAQI